MARRTSRIPVEVANQLQVIRSDSSISEASLEVLSRISQDSPGLVAMWQNLQKRNAEQYEKGAVFSTKHGSQTLSEKLPGWWVHEFVGYVLRAYDPPAHLGWVGADRRTSKKRIADLANKLVRELKNAGVGGTVLKIDSEHDLWIELSSGREVEVTSPLAKGQVLCIPVDGPAIVEAITRDAAAALDGRPVGKNGVNAKSISFVRILARHTIERYGQPLHGVLATLSNALFATDFDANDVQKRVGPASKVYPPEGALPRV